MSNKTRIWLTRFALPVAAVGAAHLLTYLLWLIVQGDLTLLFITAVMVSALYGGLAAGLVASVLASLAAAFFFLPPQNSFDIAFDDLLRLLIFVAVATFISWLSGARRRYEQALREAQAALEARVRERTAELQVANQELTEEIAERRKAEGRILAYQARLQSLAVELSTAEERQRRQIAETLHDAIGHRLAAAVMSLRGVLQEDVDGHAPRITRACELVEQTIEHTRTLTLQLSPPILYELGLEPALEWLAEQVQGETGLAVTASVDYQAAAAADEEVRTLLFNAVRELLVNVVKHAQARAACIALAREGEYLRVGVTDDGVGCDPTRAQVSAAGSGFGLFNIRERLTHLGGRFDLTSEPGRGCRVTLVAPLTVRPQPAGSTE